MTTDLLVILAVLTAVTATGALGFSIGAACAPRNTPEPSSKGTPDHD